MNLSTDRLLGRCGCFRVGALGLRIIRQHLPAGSVRQRNPRPKALERWRFLPSCGVHCRLDAAAVGMTAYHNVGDPERLDAVLDGRHHSVRGRVAGAARRHEVGDDANHEDVSGACAKEAALDPRGSRCR